MQEAAGSSDPRILAPGRINPPGDPDHAPTPSGLAVRVRQAPGAL